MAVTFSYLLSGAGLLLLLPVVVLFVEVMLAQLAPPRCARSEGARARLAVLMPAHDEASIIASTLRSVMPQLAPGDRLVVVADNCRDDTARIAAAEGAEVITRSDQSLLGKGYALDFGVRQLAQDAPEIVIIVDADCELGPGALDTLARVCMAARRPVQALYLMRAGSDAGLKLRIAEFAFKVKNLARPAGLRRLGLPCQLMGTGMAFPWQLISTAPLATGHIVEDLKLGIDLALAGSPPLFCPDALVTSRFASSSEGSRTQRTRWEHGHIGVILHDAPRLAADALRRFDGRSFALAVDLAVPPLALLALLELSVWTAGVALYAATRIALPAMFATLSLLLFGATVLAAWWRHGREIVSLGNLGFAVIYALMKVPMYAKFLVARQLSWVRSKRDGE